MPIGPFTTSFKLRSTERSSAGALNLGLKCFRGKLEGGYKAKKGEGSQSHPR